MAESLGSGIKSPSLGGEFFLILGLKGCILRLMNSLSDFVVFCSLKLSFGRSDLELCGCCRLDVTEGLFWITPGF